MGKYMKKSKIAGDMEASSETTALGVRTRAAMKRLNDSSSYLQLRSHRLHQSEIKASPADSACSSVPVARDQCSFGESSLDFESRHSTRESTPGNFVEDLEIIVTSGCSRRSMGTATTCYTRDRDSMVPTTSELEEFFAYAEQQQQRLFMDKYNFDIVNDMPLTGRYEWVQVSPWTSEEAAPKIHCEVKM